MPFLVAADWLCTEHGWRGLGRLLSPASLTIFTAVTCGWLLSYLAV